MKHALIVAMMAVVAWLAGDAKAGVSVEGESLVLVGTTAGKLLYTDVDEGSVFVRSTYLPGGVTYEKGKDYTIDAKAGTIARTEGSRIPDFATNVLYGKEGFDHTQFPGYGNGKFFVFVDYESKAEPIRLAAKVNYADRLKKTEEKLRFGRALKIIAYGDSITAGGEASSVALQFPARYVEYLKTKYPKASITWENGATGGDTTREGLVRLNDKVLTRSPDLVLVAFGMNDHNLPGVGGVPIPEFKENLAKMISQIREKTGAEVILISTFPPNPKWAFGSHRMEQYAAATKDVADETKCAFADLNATWQTVLKRKNPESLLGNNINHPNDFGHWLYLEALKAIDF
jgi:acyl-CoA thioesterase-1